MTSRILVALAAAVVPAALAVPIAVAAPATAAPAWQTAVTLSGAKVQLCKAPVTGNRWRVRVRVDARGADRVTAGRLQVRRPDGAAGQLWLSGSVDAGSVSKAGSALVPRGKPAYRLLVGLENSHVGRGEKVAINAVRAC
ncbi:hypothetical protein [Nocardioides sp. W7]|uniref:hypothetical protein n=1 Tax=Nocardioides sp. W7 TaxID=2931390 RepID=UPI001FD17079|nr:hypothetical protein [Nocardioides sp. W7]